MNATLDQMNAALEADAAKSPFLLENEGAYQAWRVRKLGLLGRHSAERVFELDDSGRLPEALRPELREQIGAYNFAIFETRGAFDKDAFLALNREFGLLHADGGEGDSDRGVTALRAVDEADALSRYIPYTRRALNWHTDGYYNPPGRRISAFSLYCVSQARRGGGNFLFDHELMYLLIRDREPGLLAALMADDMMRIPANVQGGQVLRAEESGPVFSLQPGGRGLNMRYTSRPRNIEWKSDRLSRRALDLVREILVDGGAAIELRLQAGQGIVCNNILHGREAFRDLADEPARLVYRARYLEAIDLERQPQQEGA
ncbi:MAG: TauD/TfdA family dioxygenase [Gammaproteobacteria bacterium]